MKRSIFSGKVPFTEAKVDLCEIQVAESIGYNSVIVGTNS